MANACELMVNSTHSQLFFSHLAEPSDAAHDLERLTKPYRTRGADSKASTSYSKLFDFPQITFQDDNVLQLILWFQLMVVCISRP